MEAECAPSARESPAAESPAAVLATQAGSLEPSAASPSARSPAVPSFTMRKQDLNAAPAAFRVRGLTQPSLGVQCGQNLLSGTSMHLVHLGHACCFLKSPACPDPDVCLSVQCS